MTVHEGKVALVTGGGRGIGESIAERLSQAGAQVAIADLSQSRAQAVADRLGGDALALAVNVADEDAVAAMVASVVERFGRLDYAFNNAGISDTPKRLVDFEAESWHHMIEVNMTSVFYCMKHEIRQFLTQETRDERRGAIVNTSSGAGIIAAPGQPHYTAAKHGVLGLTKVGAQEYGAEGVRVNAICPGVTDTPMVTSSLPKEILDQVLKTMPEGRMGRPDDVAAAAIWLCSDEARWVNGQSLIVDGGGVVR
ncbi:MAG: glucose 1-dehydrogenase [Phycisphaerales bacterium]|nr:glucose 1-dehydrogenase [Phycisphaerales bacterium]